MVQNRLIFKLFLIFLFFSQKIVSQLNLSVIEPAILKNHFKTGLEFKEIINGHRLRSFENKVDIHMLKGKNGSGCSRFDMEDVSFIKILQISIIII